MPEALKETILPTSYFCTVPAADTTGAAKMIMILIMITALIYRVVMLCQALG